MLQIDLGDSKTLRELQSPLYFVGTLLYESGWRKRTRLDISESQMTVIRVPATKLHNQVLMLFTSHLRKQKRREFWAESSVVKASWDSHGAR